MWKQLLLLAAMLALAFIGVITCAPLSKKKQEQEAPEKEIGGD